MDPQRWQQLQQLFQQAIAQPQAEREAWARRACRDDGAMLAQLQGLLRQVGETTDPVVEVIRDAARAALASPPRSAAARGLRHRMVHGARTGTIDSAPIGRVELLALDAALDRLAERDAELAAQLERSLFGPRAAVPDGEAAAPELERRLAFARAWVYLQMRQPSAGADDRQY